MNVFASLLSTFSQTSKCLSFRHGFTFSVNIFCLQCFIFVHSDKIASASFSNLSTQLKHTMLHGIKWLNRVQFTLIACVCVGRLKNDYHSKASSAIFLLTWCTVNSFTKTDFYICVLYKRGAV